MDRYQIIGVFWQGADSCLFNKMHPFVGEIIVNETGGFEGEIEDSYGRVKIKGRLNSAKMDFLK